MLVAGFDWDDGNRQKMARHGLSTQLVEEVMRGPLKVAPDPAHSTTEKRFRAVGRSASGERAVFVVFTLRQRDGATFIRPISARFMHAKEIRRYEETHS